MPNQQDPEQSDEATRRVEHVSEVDGGGDPVLPRKIGDYLIESQIGSGGMGSVYKAFDASLKRTVAVKVLHASLSLSSTTQKRFAREAWIAGQLEHEGIVRVYQRGEEQGISYFAMEYADGGSLAKIIRERARLASDKGDVSETNNSEYIRVTVQKFVELADALAYIHAKGFIHRDIKPHNILIAGPDRRFKFADFGIAHADDMTQMTRPGDFIGTVKYMSPELLAAHRATVDHRTDIYSLGIALYEALTLTVPYDADSEERYISEIISGHAIPARRRNRRISKDLETIVLKATAHDPLARYQSAKEFGEDLNRYLESRPITAKRESPLVWTYKYLKRHGRLVLVMLLAGLLTLVGTGLIMRSLSQKRDERRIIATLSTALRLKKSPFELEQDWPRLSRILREYLRSGRADAMTQIFYRLNSLMSLEYRRFSTIERAAFSISLMRIQCMIPDSVLGPGGRRLAVEESFALELSTTFGSVNNGPFSDIGYFLSHYGRGRSEGCALGLTIPDLGDSTPGLKKVVVKTMAQHFLLGASVFVRSSEPSARYYTNGTLRVSAQGDTLIECGWQSGCGCGAPREYILDTLTLLPAKPVFVDTILDSFEVFTFQDYPASFPSMVRGKDGSAFVVYDTKLFVDTAVEKREMVLRMKTSHPSLLMTPLAGDFAIIDFSTGETLLSGLLEVGQTIGFNSISIGFDGQSRLYGSMKWSHGDTTEFAFKGDSFRDSTESFPKLARLGRTRAVMRIVPSITAARFFGDFDTYAADTLSLVTYFEAKDTANLPKGW